MSNLKACITNEIYKLFLKKKTYILLLIMVIVSSLSALLLSAIQAKLVFLSLTSISFPLLMLSILTNLFLPLFVFMAAAELFPGEIADRTLKLVLTMPISRLKIYIAKLTAIIFYLTVNLLAVLIISTVTALLLKLGVPSYTQVLGSYLIDILPAVVLALFAVFLVQFFRTPSTAMISCILAFIGIRTIGPLISGLSSNLFTSYLNWSSFWFNSVNLSHNAILLGLLSAYGIIFFTLGYYKFDKTEV